MKAVGLVTISGITDGFGKPVSTEDAIRYGWITAPVSAPGWDLERHEVPLGENLFVDQGRQLMAYAFGFRSPLVNYTVQKFGVGTGATAARVTDVNLEAPITLSNGFETKEIDSVDYLTPFVVRVAFTLGLADANGYIISEMGLYSGNDTLIARKIRAVSVNKTSDFSPTLTWRLRF